MSRHYRFTLKAVLAWGSLLHVAAAPVAVHAYPANPPSPEAFRKEREAWKATIDEDRTRIPMMIEMLRKPEHADDLFVALHGLACLGAVQALPLIDGLPANWPGLSLPSEVARNFAQAAQARLVAEASTEQIKNPDARAASTIQRFYQEIHLDPIAVNSAVAKFERIDRIGTTIPPTWPPVELYAMREVADMVYRGPYGSFGALPEVATLHFSLDYPSALKVRMARLSPEQRVEALVEELVHLSEAPSSGHDYLSQLAMDGGPAVKRAIVARLSELDAHRDQHPAGEFSALFAVLRAMPDPVTVSILQRFASDPDRRIAAYAAKVMTGFMSRPLFVAGY